MHACVQLCEIQVKGCRAFEMWIKDVGMLPTLTSTSVRVKIFRHIVTPSRGTCGDTTWDGP